MTAVVNKSRIPIACLMIAFTSAFLSSCALLNDLNEIDKTKARVCNYDGAFKQGMQDAKAGYPLDSKRITNYCDGVSVDEALKGYREGYMTGKKPN